MKLPELPVYFDDLLRNYAWSSVEPLPRNTKDAHKKRLMDAIFAYGQVCREAALEDAALVCESRQTPGTGSVAILNGAAFAIRALKDGK